MSIDAPPRPPTSGPPSPGQPNLPGPASGGQIKPKNVMRKVSLRNLAAHKIRLALTVISVVLGTAFVAGSFVFTDTLQKAFDGIFADSYKGVAVNIQPVNDRGDGVPTSYLDTLKTVPGVSRVEPEVTGYLVLVGADGKPVQSGGAPSQGLAWLGADNSIETPPTFVSGQAPTEAGQIAINEGAATKSKLTVGEQTKVVSASGGITNVTVSGIYHTKTETGGYIGVFFTEDQALQLFTDGSHVSAVDVAAQPGTSETTLLNSIESTLPTGTKAITGTQARADVQSDVRNALKFINYILVGFGLVALVVGTFIIYNTFSMIVAQRLRELALLRAVGADRKQISRAVLFEAVIVGLIGSLLGIAGGAGLAYGLKALLKALDLGLPSGSLVLAARTVIVSVVLGVLVTVVSAYVPARRAARTPPVEAMRAEFASTGTSLRRRTIIGLIPLVLGALATVAGATSSSAGAGSSLVGLGLVLSIIAVLMLSPVLCQWIIGVVGLVIGRPFGTLGRLARSNAIRNPRRTSATAFALTLGLTLVSAISVVGSSTKASLGALIDNGVKADLIVTTGNTIPVPQAAAEALSKVPGVGSVVRLHGLNSDATGPNGTTQKLNADAVDGNPADVFSLKMLQGSETVSATSIIVAKTEASTRGWHVGDQITLSQQTGAKTEVTVGGIYADTQLFSSVIASGDTYRTLTPTDRQADEVDFVNAAPGTSLATLRTAIEQVTDPYLVIKVQDKAEFKGQTSSSINGLLNVLYGLLGLAIIIAVLGIINTLALSVVERRREIGMLRAVGMVRGQLRRTIYLESALIAIFGAVLGLALGLTFGALFTHLLRDSGLGTLSIPWAQAITFLIVSAVVGVLAALWPAFRAARIRPLDAITE